MHAQREKGHSYVVEIFAREKDCFLRGGGEERERPRVSTLLRGPLVGEDQNCAVREVDLRADRRQLASRRAVGAASGAPAASSCGRSTPSAS